MQLTVLHTGRNPARPSAPSTAKPCRNPEGTTWGCHWRERGRASRSSRENGAQRGESDLSPQAGPFATNHPSPACLGPAPGLCWGTGQTRAFVQRRPSRQASIGSPALTSKPESGNQTQTNKPALDHKWSRAQGGWGERATAGSSAPRPSPAPRRLRTPGCR